MGMKKSIGYIVLLFVLLFLFVFKDFLSSYLIKKDFNLEKSIVLDNDYQNLKREYEALLETSELNLPFLEKGIVSKVVLHDPYVFFDEITILKGKEEGISEQDIIVNEKGYVGRIKTVLGHTSQVELLTNKNTTLSVKIQNSYGILKVENNQLIVRDITSKEEIQENTTVYTSSFTNIPEEIPIGKVIEVDSSSLEQKIIVEPFVDFNNLNYVYIRKSVSYE